MKRKLDNSPGGGGGRNLKKLELTATSSGLGASCHRHLALIPRTGYGRNAVVFDQAVLELPNPIADPDTFDSVVAAYTARAELLDAEVSLSGQVRGRVMSRIGDPPTLTSLAKALHMAPRPLRVALAKEKTSYQAVIKSCRIEYASVLFRNPALSVTQIAHRLGYSDVSAFAHSFGRWTGQSPAAFRIKILARRTSS